MAITFVPTAGAADANSFATVAQFKAYIEAHPHGSAAAALSDDRIKQLLILATSGIVDAYEWEGMPATFTQNLPFPRVGLVSVSGALMASDVIPVFLVEATCEFARQLHDGDRTADNEAEAQGLSRFKAGPVELDFKPGATSKLIPDAVDRKLSRWGHQRNTRGVVKLQRV